MPRDGDPRVTVRFSPQEETAISAVAESVNVSMGALIRECAVRYAATVAADVANGTVRLRRARVDMEVVEAVAPHVSTARSLLVESTAMAHQRRLNEMKERAAGAKGAKK